jgi:hypothetical protein
LITARYALKEREQASRSKFFASESPVGGRGHGERHPHSCQPSHEFVRAWHQWHAFRQQSLVFGIHGYGDGLLWNFPPGKFLENGEAIFVAVAYHLQENRLGHLDTVLARTRLPGTHTKSLGVKQQAVHIKNDALDGLSQKMHFANK